MAEDQTGKKREDHEATLKGLPGRHLIALESPMLFGKSPRKECFVYDKAAKADLIGTSVLVTLDINNKRPVWVITGTYHVGGSKPAKLKGIYEGAVRRRCVDLIEAAGAGDPKDRLVNGGLGVQYFRHLNDEELGLFNTLFPTWVEDEVKAREDAEDAAKKAAEARVASAENANKQFIVPRVLKGGRNGRSGA